jgi:cellulose synthase/poly-beta-1,6-N-acetylglucosamine synthase-like glycosyltransferase
LLTLLTAFLNVTALLLLMPVAVLFTEVMAAIAWRHDAPVEESERKRVAIVMPAHNEASIIAATLDSLAPQLGRADRLIVVADNCSDGTASIAAAHGAEVIVRTDTVRRGKGYALDFGVRHLEADAPAIVIIIDADCRVSAGAIDKLAQLCALSGRPVQALYLMQASKGAGLKTKIAEFAWAVKNRARATGLLRLGLPCQLMGSGMAFSWPCISTAALATGHIVEDLKLGIDLTRAGTPPLFCPDALITSSFPESEEGFRSQRTRWEHGHLGLILAETPPLLASSVRKLDLNLLALALDLMVPPLALLALLLAGFWFADLALYIFSGMRFPLSVASISIVLLLVSVLLAWQRYGRSIVSFGNLLYAIFYALRKIPLYAKFILARQLDWVRSRRDDGKG